MKLFAHIERNGGMDTIFRELCVVFVYVTKIYPYNFHTPKHFLFIKTNSKWNALITYVLCLAYGSWLQAATRNVWLLPIWFLCFYFFAFLSFCVRVVSNFKLQFIAYIHLLHSDKFSHSVTHVYLFIFLLHLYT